AGLKIEPNNMSLLQARGDLYIAMNRPQDAVNDYNKAVAASPKNAQLLINRAIYENESGEYQKAVDDCNKAIAIESSPGTTEKWTHLKIDAIATRANAYVLSGDPNKAIETIKPLIALDESKYPLANWDNAKWVNQLSAHCLNQAKNGTNFVNNFANASTTAKPLSPAQLWVLACCAIITENCDYKHNVLWLVDYPPEAQFVAGKPLSKWWLSVFSERQSIANSWGIYSRNDLLEMLVSLAANDNTNPSSSIPQPIKDPLKKSSVSDYLLGEDYSNASFLFSPTERKKQEEEKKADEIRRQAAEKLGPKPKLAWNLCRFIYLCRAGVLCGYLTEAEAWTSMTAQAKVLKEKFSSWNELGSNYMMRRRVWNTVAATGKKSEKSFQKLNTNPNSPWKTIPWTTDLGAN
ncbi:MAG: DUF1266 domain-containing protein, partial [Candidatus Obscuribacterales bacterium]|nr:DUF1266 domain-containing protein [Candidatus Obscuribacterales bacterium]